MQRTRPIRFVEVPGALFCTLVLAVMMSCSSPGGEGTVLRVVDGDTLVVQYRGEPRKIRLYGIDAPEKAQPHGKSATRFLSRQVKGRAVRIEEMDTDRYGRIVAVVSTDGRNINQQLVREGHAWVYERYCRRYWCGEWKKLEEQARQEHRGLWAADEPTPPWQWRHKDTSFAEHLPGRLEQAFHLIRKLLSRFL